MSKVGSNIEELSKKKVEAQGTLFFDQLFYRKDGKVEK
jgi:hypothetical protein